MTEQPKRYPDENEIEKILDKIYIISWIDSNLYYSERNLSSDLQWVLEIWSKKYLGHDHLKEIIKSNYGNVFNEKEPNITQLRELDLVIFFFSALHLCFRRVYDERIS